MNLKAILGDKFKEDMTVEEINTALADFDPTNGMIKKDLFDRTASELAAAKKQLKEKLTADEQAKAEQDAINQKNRRFAKGKSANEAERVLRYQRLRSQNSNRSG